MEQILRTIREMTFSAMAMAPGLGTVPYGIAYGSAANSWPSGAAGRGGDYIITQKGFSCLVADEDGALLLRGGAYDAGAGLQVFWRAMNLVHLESYISD
jgi:hypothetical protein